MLISYTVVVDLLAARGVSVSGIAHVGAHRLQELDAYERSGVPRDRIVWFEAQADLVYEAVARGVPNVVHAALSDTERDVFMEITNDSWSSSLLPRKVHETMHPDVSVTHRVPVRTTLFSRYADAVRHCNLWNMDVQGMELSVLRGATPEMLARVDALYLEVNEFEIYQGCAQIPELEAWLAERGFVRVALQMTEFGWGDALYARRRFSLLHATRGRAEQAARCRQLWLARADFPEHAEYIFGVDEDDAQRPDGAKTVVVEPGGAHGHGCVAAWNKAAFAATGDVLVQVSDDFVPPRSWDSKIWARLRGAPAAAVLAVSDGDHEAPGSLLTMAVCTRAYFELDHFLLHPDFTSMYSDDHFTEVAYRRGAVVEARDLVFFHAHPSQCPAVEPDARYAAQNAPALYAQGRATLDALRSDDWTHVIGTAPHWPRILGALRATPPKSLLIVGDAPRERAIVEHECQKRAGVPFRVAVVPAGADAARIEAEYDVVVRAQERGPKRKRHFPGVWCGQV